MFRTLTQLEKHQDEWAADNGIQVNPSYPHYVSQLEDNLLLDDLSVLTRIDFTEGKGSELSELVDGGRPAKMKAFHSSSALVANVFDYWTDRTDKSGLASAISKLSATVSGASDTITNIRFEYLPDMPTGTASPNLDVLLTHGRGNCIAIESKFTEWQSPHREKKSPFSEVYFANGKKYWTDAGLPNCQQLAEEWHTDETKRFSQYLNVPQLLKHSLGLANVPDKHFDLWYLFYDFDNDVSKVHENEIREFADRVGSELRFRSFSYQKLISALKQECTRVDLEHVSKLCERYGV